MAVNTSSNTILMKQKLARFYYNGKSIKYFKKAGFKVTKISLEWPRRRINIRLHRLMT